MTFDATYHSRLAEVLHNIATSEVADPSPAHIEPLQKVFHGREEEEIRADLARVLNLDEDENERLLSNMSKVAYALGAGPDKANPVHSFRELHLLLMPLFNGKSEQDLMEYFTRAGNGFTSGTGLAIGLRQRIGTPEMGRRLSE